LISYAYFFSVVFGGVLIGNAFWGPFADYFGRRIAFIAGKKQQQVK
jgi:hypothetical protein